jgi:hypothetical protein
MGTREKSVLALALFCAACGESQDLAESATAESCMTCHNGSRHDDYAGPGIENPHPFGSTDLACTTCHGGNGAGQDELSSHVPPPPEIGHEDNWLVDPEAYFNRLTLAGLDRYANYTVDGRHYTALDYLQFVNPGDLRVVTKGRACGQCHEPHADGVEKSMLATETGIFSGALYTLGLENQVPANQGLHEDTASDLAFRAVQDPAFVPDPNEVGRVGSLKEVPVFSVFGAEEADSIFENPLYDAANLPSSVQPDNSIANGSPVANLFMEQVSFTCGDCHLGSAGANNRYGDFRSSGCTACHMRYSPDGRSRTGDPNVDRHEPANPDAIQAPERAHPRRHLIQSIAKTLPGGEQVSGISDYACAGCHQGSNRTVMQYWGIRLDQNADLANHAQYPANPASFENTAHDERLFDPQVGNHTFNGRNANQYVLHEDYDGDGRDDTPPDVHYEAGLGCIDCHGSHDLHGGDVSQPALIQSRMEQNVSIRCESCHGSATAYAATVAGTNYADEPAELAIDREGLPLKHVEREPDGSYWLTSRLTGKRHYVSQTRDVVVDTGKIHPRKGQPVYSAKASFAMGRDDGDLATGLGPQQSGSPTGFSHADSVDCAACHASWTNTCIGCHLGGEYDTGANFSNITGQRIVFKQANADFTYQSPVPFQLGVGYDGKVSVIAPNTDVFWQYEDRHTVDSQVFSFTDRNGGGNNPAVSSHPALSHNMLMPHSIRGKVSAKNEGPRYCVACHLTTHSLGTWGAQYAAMRAAMGARNYGALDYDLLRTHIGSNPGNQLDSPLWVHMVAGLGTGLFLFDANGAPVNPLDTNANRVGAGGVAPASVFDPLRARLDLDRLVEPSGVSNGSNAHMFLVPGSGSALRDGSSDPELTGPLGATLVRRLADPTNGIVLDAWLDANATPRGGAVPLFP